MIKIAVVDDEAEERKQIIEYFNRLSLKLYEKLDVFSFESGETLLSKYDYKWDIICLDIQMNGENGIEIAKKIRELDNQVIIIFITNLAQMAIEGYSVRALDFIVKPLNYYSFELKMQSIIKSVINKVSKNIVINHADGWKKISTDDLCYVEVEGHYISYHTTNGIYKQKATLKKLEEYLKGLSFKRCNNCYLVNLKHVDIVRKDEVLVNEDWLRISRPRKKEFLQALANYMVGFKI